MDYVAQPKDYWIAPNAIYIALNALTDPNRMTGSAASGASILCYIKGVKPASAGAQYADNGDGLEYDNGHNYRRWPITVSPTYFNTFDAKYVYAAIPRSLAIGTKAVVVFPSQQLDIYGKNSNNEQIGSKDYFYIFLQGIISSSGDSGTTSREWQSNIQYGTLSSDEAIADQTLNTDWYSYSVVSQVVTFLKEIIMSEDSKFQNLKADLLNLGGGILTQVAGENTPVNSDVAVATPAYVSNHFLSKTTNDTAAGKITFEQGLEAGVFEPDSQGAALYKDEYDNWHFEADYLYARKRLTAKEVRIEKESHIGGSLLLTAASARCDFVEDMGTYWRCFFRRVGENGEQIFNEWKIGDQAYVNTFNLVRQEDGTTGNHYYWRLVVNTSNDTADNNTYTVEGEELNAADYHFIDLSKNVCSDRSAAPKANDDIVQLGYQPNDDSDRQNAIIMAGAGNASPYIREFIGINTFHLPTSDTQLKPGDNKLTGKVQMVSGSTFPDGSNVEQFINDTNSNIDGLQNTIETLDTGNENLLLNTGFTGDFTDEKVRSDDEMEDSTEMYSRQLKYWEYKNAEVVQTAESASGYGVYLSSGSISQPLTKPMTEGSWYCISFKAKGGSAVVTLGGYQQVVTFTPNTKRYIVKMACEDANATAFTLSGATGTLMEIMVTEGRIPNTDWLPSPQDNDKSLAYYQNLSYLMSAITNASTTILGGLILSQMLRVGNYRDGVMTEETGGMSGLYMNELSPFLWGGGDMDAAFYTINKYAQNPAYQATDEEVAQMAKFVVTHGGRAILNDIILRGYIYALGGRFQGEVIAESGVFKNVHSQDNKFEIDSDGNFSCKDARISGNMYSPLLVIDSSNAHIYLTATPQGYIVKLDLTGLNIQIDDRVFSTTTTVKLPITSVWNGAKAHIYNTSGYEVIVSGATGTGNNYVLQTGDFGVFFCYHASGDNYFWKQIN